MKVSYYDMCSISLKQVPYYRKCVPPTDRSHGSPGRRYRRGSDGHQHPDEPEEEAVGAYLLVGRTLPVRGSGDHGRYSQRCAPSTRLLSRQRLHRPGSCKRELPQQPPLVFKESLAFTQVLSS